MVSNTCEFVVGRLLEIRVAAGYGSVADVEQMISMIGARMRQLLPDEKLTIAADWRAVHIMSPETSARAREMLAQVNARVKRSAILVLPETSVANLQVVRLVREAESASRRVFTSPADMHAWLSEVLTKDEATRAAVFLGISGQ